jgi:hypothetical protein
MNIHEYTLYIYSMENNNNTAVSAQKVLNVIKKAVLKKFETGYHFNIWTGAEKDEYHFRPKYVNRIDEMEATRIMDAMKVAGLTARIINGSVYVKNIKTL